MLRVLVASNNPGKVKEIQDLLEGLPVEILTPKALGIELSVQEVGESYAENAALKAMSFVKKSGVLTLADDSGLEVQALGGEPGIRSARYSPKPGASDADRRKYLLERLRASPRPWMAQFKCVLALATDEGKIQFTTGECEGEIIPLERGTNGFGYDPIFLLSDHNLTLAELTTQQKNKVSHRAKAVNKMISYLEQHL